VIVVLGCLAAVADVTKRPVMLERLTAVAFAVPRPTRSVVVVLGDRAAVDLLTKRPLLALRLTVRAMTHLLTGSSIGEPIVNAP
jgi:hypothetical protein